jgi:hypothetical protein
MSAPQFEGTSPLISDRYIITMTAGEDLTMGQVVELTDVWTVKKPTAANSKKIVGICLTNALNGKKVSIVCRGICRAIAYGAIAAGDQLTNHSSGGKVKTDNSTLNTTIIGMSVETIASGGTGVIILW